MFLRGYHAVFTGNRNGGAEAAEAEQRILGGETVVTKRRVTNEGDG